MTGLSSENPPLLLFVIGPPAVGKMTVGAEIAKRTGLRLLHNHQTIDLVLGFFPFGTPPYQRLVGEFRRRILDEVAASTLPGLIFTYVWAFDDPRDQAAVDEYAAPFKARGGRVVFLELEATLDERLRRNEHADRLAAKPGKRDLARSRELLLKTDAEYQLNSAGRFDGRPDYLRLDNTLLSPDVVAEHAITALALTRLSASAQTP